MPHELVGQLGHVVKRTRALARAPAACLGSPRRERATRRPDGDGCTPTPALRDERSPPAAAQHRPRVRPRALGDRGPHRRRDGARTSRPWRRRSARSRPSCTSSTGPPAQNISDAQVKSQITILNEDFRKTNADTSKVPGAVQAARRGLQHRVQARDEGHLRQRDRRHHAHADERRRRSASTTSVKSSLDRRRRPVAGAPLPERLGLQPRRRPARLRAVPRAARRRPTAS